MRFTRRDSSSSRWTAAGALPIDQLGAVVSAAWAPDGTLAIAVVPASQGGPWLYRASARGEDFGAPRPIAFAGRACEVSWRSDARELVVAGRRADDGRPCPDVLGADHGSAARVLADGSKAVPLGEDVIDPVYQPIALEG